jgi:hypothetical protein
VLEVNLRSMFFARQAAARVMREQGDGRILNIGSGADLLTVSNITPYGISKAASATPPLESTSGEHTERRRLAPASDQSLRVLRRRRRYIRKRP